MPTKKKNSLTSVEQQQIPAAQPVVNTPSVPPQAQPVVAAAPVTPVTAQNVAENKPNYEVQNTVTPPPAAKPQAPRGMPTMGSGFSISQRLTKADEKKEEENVNLFASTDGLPQTEFTHQQLLKLWDLYTDAVGAEGKYNLKSILNMAKPKMGNGFRALVTVASVTAQEELNREKSNMLEYLRKELNNYVLDLDITVDLGDTGTLKPYTASQKFQYLAQKNPVMEKLKQKLDLEVDF